MVEPLATGEGLEPVVVVVRLELATEEAETAGGFVEGVAVVEAMAERVVAVTGSVDEEDRVEGVRPQSCHLAAMAAVVGSWEEATDWGLFASLCRVVGAAVAPEATGVVFHEAAEAAATATAAAAAATEAEEADARPPAPAAPLVAGWFPVGRVAWAVVIRRR